MRGVSSAADAVVAGAASDRKGTRDFNVKIGGKMISAFRFG